MQTLTKRNAVILAVVLSAAMWATRGHHAASLAHLPDASWAIFFAVGFYFRRSLLLPLFLVQAALIDYLAITHFGVDDFCVTAAYGFLLPAYAALWYAGRWFAGHFQHQLRDLSFFAAAVLGGSAVCELISSGSFYFLGGRFAETSLAEFGQRLVQYYPGNLAWLAVYLGVAAVVHTVVTGLHRPALPAK